MLHKRISLGLVALLTGALMGLAQSTVLAQQLPSGLTAGRYDVSAAINYGAGTILVTSSASVANGTDQSFTELHFNLAPLRIGKAALAGATVNGQPADVSADDQTATVSLPSALPPGARATVVVSYSATFATSATDKNWMFAKLHGTLTAYRWIPWLDAATTFDRPNFGSPFPAGGVADVSVKVTADRQLTFATSGQRTSVSEDQLTKTFFAHNVRDFNFSADPNYRKLIGWAGSTKVIVLYKTLPAAKMRTWARTALNAYSAEVGRYVYPRLTIAESGAGSAMESPALVWIPRGSSTGSIPYLVAHETAHQWFYGMIGSDSADEPFADEAPADFLSRRLTGTFRPSKCAARRLDLTVWEYGSACYYEVIYIQGGNYINAYLMQVGDEAFWDGMRAYYDKYRLGIGGTAQFWAALDAAAGISHGHADRFPTLFPSTP